MCCTWLCLVAGTFVLNWTMCRDQNIPHLAGIVNTASQALTFLYCFSRLTVFGITHQCRIENFISWCKWLQVNTNYQTFITSGYEYIKALEFATEMVSSILFIFCTNITILVILVFYRAFSFFLGKLFTISQSLKTEPEKNPRDSMF